MMAATIIGPSVSQTYFWSNSLGSEASLAARARRDGGYAAAKHYRMTGGAQRLLMVPERRTCENSSRNPFKFISRYPHSRRNRSSLFRQRLDRSLEGSTRR